MQQFFSLLSWRLFPAQYVSGVSPPIIRNSMTEKCLHLVGDLFELSVELRCQKVKTYWLRDAPNKFNIQQLYALPTLYL
jgi:hypothetical protein